MSSLSRLATAWRLLRTRGFQAFVEEIPERLDWQTGTVTRHPRLRGIFAEISVVVPTFNGGQDLKNLLDSLASQTGCTLEILVLDSGSTDGSQELVAQYPQARWVSIPPREFSHSETRNRGVALTRFPLVFLTVQDAVLPQTDWLSRLAGLREAEQLGALAAAESPRPDADTYARYSLDSHYRGLRLPEDALLVHRQWKGSRRERIRAASIGNIGCLYQRDLLIRYPFYGTFGEDFTLGVRLLKAGFAVGKTSEFKVIHSHTRSAFYALKRMAVSRRLMTDLDLARPEEPWTEDSLLRFVAGLAWFFPDRWVSVEEKDPLLMAWILSLGFDTADIVLPHQALLDIVREVEPYASGSEQDRKDLSLKALAGRIGWILGGASGDLWSTPGRKRAVEGLSNGV